MKLNSIISALVALGFGGVLWHMNGARRGAVEVVFPDDQAIAPAGEVVPLDDIPTPENLAPVDQSAPRGIRNHNPGNIERGSDQWQGMSATQTDARYLQFATPFWGIRALARILKNYESRHDINTVRGMISRWAPPTNNGVFENDTSAYIRSVSIALNIGPDEPFSIQSRLLDIVPAIIKHENGQQPYASLLIAQAVAAS